MENKLFLIWVKLATQILKDLHNISWCVLWDFQESQFHDKTSLFLCAYMHSQ